MNLGYEVTSRRTAALAPSAVTSTCKNCGKKIGKTKGASGGELWVTEGSGGTMCSQTGKSHVSKTSGHDDSYGDDWDDTDWNNYSAGFEQAKRGEPLEDGHGQPFQDGHYDGTLIHGGGHAVAAFRVTAKAKTVKVKGGYTVRCDSCGLKPHSGPETMTYEGATQTANTHNELHHKVAALTVTAQQVGYYVVSRNGVPISGPYATRSDAAPNMIEQRGAAVMFIGPGNGAEWDALKAKPFPVGTNTVNGSRKTSTVATPGADIDYNSAGSGHSTCTNCGKPIAQTIRYHGDEPHWNHWDDNGYYDRCGTGGTPVTVDASRTASTICGHPQCEISYMTEHGNAESHAIHGDHQHADGWHPNPHTHPEWAGNPQLEREFKNASWDTEEDPWAGEQHTASGLKHFYPEGPVDCEGPNCWYCRDKGAPEDEDQHYKDLAERYGMEPGGAYTTQRADGSWPHTSEVSYGPCPRCHDNTLKLEGDRSGKVGHCSNCGWHSDSATVPPDTRQGSMQERYADGRRVANLRHFAYGDEEVEEDDDEWAKFPKGLGGQVDIGEAPAPELQDPNPIAGQDLVRVPRNLAEAAAMYASYYDDETAGQDPYDERHWGNMEDQYPEDAPHDQLDDPWNGPTRGEGPHDY